MKAIGRTAIVCIGAVCLSVSALEGDLRNELKKELTEYKYSENCAGDWKVRDVVREFNKWEKIKIGIDLRWVQAGKTVTDFKTTEKNVLASCELLAEKLNAHVYVVRDFLFITPELPPGLSPAGLHAAGNPPPAPEAKPEKPPDPPPGPSGKKPPPSGKSPPPPANKTPADKPLPQMKPLTPGSGLAELTAAFPGILPGTSHLIGWSHRSMKDCLTLGNPIVLLSYYSPADPKAPAPDEKKTVDRLEKENKDTSNFFETLILEDPDLLKELKGNVEFICIPSTEPPENWPAAYSEAAKKEGAALFLIAKDGHNVLSWPQRNTQCTAGALAQAVRPLIPAKPKPPAKPDNKEVAKKPEAPQGGANGNPPADNGPAKPKNDASHASKVGEE
jgi:hypothetical protein